MGISRDVERLMVVSDAHPAPWKALGGMILDRNGDCVIEGLDEHIAGAIAHTFNDHAVVHYLSKQKKLVDI